MLDLILLRHGQSQWNELNLFTGWQDVDLTTQGEHEAKYAGVLLRDSGLDIRVLHTSVLTRAIRTAELALHEAGRSWVPVMRDWRLNERHYGDLTGKDKKQTADEFGIEQVKIWRRSYDIPPPALSLGDERRSDTDPRYRDLEPSHIPATECLKDVVARVTGYFTGALAPELRAQSHSNSAVLVTAHGNSLRALRMMIEHISPEAITELEIPTGIPFRYQLHEDLTVQRGEYLGDPEVAREAARAVGRQAG